MWAYTLTAPRHFEKIDIPAPREEDLKEGQLLLRTLIGGICGSDLIRYTNQRISLPGWPMHEIVGEVVVSASPHFAVGTRVVGWAANDAIQEFIVSDDSVVAQYDNALSPDVAILIQTLACVIYAVDQVGDVKGQRVAVLGQGPIGLLFDHVLKTRGASYIIGVDLVDRSGFADAFGIDEVVHASTEHWSANLSDADRPTVVIEAIGHQAFTLGDAMNAVAIGGRLYYFGIPEEAPVAFDLNKFLRKQLTMTAGVTQARRHYLELANEHLKLHPFLAEHYVTHIFDVTEVEKAFEEACSPSVGRLKIAVKLA